MSHLIELLEDPSGASAAEYALILAIIGLGTVIAAVYLGDTVGNSMSCAGSLIELKGNANC